MKNKIKTFFSIKSRKNDNKVSKEEIAEGKLMATISYILAPIPYLAEKENDFVIYHAKQGMTLFTIGLIYFIADAILRQLFVVRMCNPFCFYRVSPVYTFISTISSLIIVIYCGIGIYNVFTGKTRPLPIIGHIKLFK